MRNGLVLNFLMPNADVIVTPGPQGQQSEPVLAEDKQHDQKVKITPNFSFA